MKVSPFEGGPFLDTHSLQGRTLSSGARCQVPGNRCPVSGIGLVGQNDQRVVLGLPPTRAIANRTGCHPRESGGPFSIWNTMDSRLRGNDMQTCGTRVRKNVKIAGTNSTTPLESIKAPKNELKTNWFCMQNRAISGRLPSSDEEGSGGGILA